ncbi:MAG: thiamine biosynthesis protein ThiF [Epsilonproteobacteria bacterium]|nr:thiamine biosynthesis protein ThiF [Campylobacterota bacterium]
MIPGFKADSPLVCEGIIGDGCGGGRIFFIEDEKLQVYDPITKKRMILLEDVNNVLSISKKGCIITLKYENKESCLDLSKI